MSPVTDGRWIHEGKVIVSVRHEHLFTTFSGHLRAAVYICGKLIRCWCVHGVGLDMASSVCLILEGLQAAIGK